MSNNIGQNIKRIRMSRNISQEYLADSLRVSPKTVSSWEVGRTEPRMGMIEKICDVLNCKKSEIVGRDVVSLFENTQGYYTDPDTSRLMQFLFDNPQYKVLFDAAANVPPEDVKKALKAINLFIE